MGFVDFSTLERRKFFCEEELRLNQRTSKHLYLDIVPIGFVNGKPKIGLQPAADYAVRMREFPADARLDRRLGARSAIMECSAPVETLQARIRLRAAEGQDESVVITLKEH